MEGVEPGTVWTWNAIGKQGGAWRLAADAPEATTGFLLNHLISEHLPQRGDDGRRITNSDPITGQAAGSTCACDLTKCERGEHGTAPLRAAASRGAPMPRGRAVLRWPERT